MKWMKTNEAAEYCGCHPVTRRKAAVAGEVVGAQAKAPYGSWKFRQSDLDAWVTGRAL